MDVGFPFPFSFWKMLHFSSPDIPSRSMSLHLRALHSQQYRLGEIHVFTDTQHCCVTSVWLAARVSQRSLT